MPYATNEDLPASVRDHLPAHAQDIFRETFNSAWKQHRGEGAGEREERSFRIAWAAVKRRYRKAGDRWIPLTPLGTAVRDTAD
jgi:cation transport regulator